MTRRSPRQFEDFEQWLTYGKEQGYDKLSDYKELHRIDGGYYAAGLKNFRATPSGAKLRWLDLLGLTRKRRRWNSLEAWLEFAQNQGYDKLSPKELEDKDAGFYTAGHTHTLTDEDGVEKKWIENLGLSRLQRRKWKSLSEWLAFGQGKGYAKLSRRDIQRVDAGYYDTGMRRRGEDKSGPEKRWMDFLQPALKYRRLSFNEWLSYGKKMGYDKLSRAQLNDRDTGYYQTGINKSVKTANFKGKWIDLLIPEKIRTASQLEHFLSADPRATALAQLSTVNGCAGEVAELLVAMYPDSFKDAAFIARALPKAVPSVIDAIVPVDLPSTANWYRRVKHVPKPIARKLEDLLYTVLFETYQERFNQDPQGVIDEIHAVGKANPSISGLAKRLERAYHETLQFNIPGYGKMGGRK